MKRVLVTGAAGFLGSHLCKALQARGDVVVGLYRDVYMDLFIPCNHVAQGDVQNLALMRRLLAEYEVDTVVHLAAQTQVSVGLENPEGMIRENVNGALSVLEACRLQKTRRVIMASTDKVYGESSEAYREKTPLMERTPYGVSKACLDMLAQTYWKTYAMGVAITRCGNLYGPGHLNWSTLIPGTIRKLIRGERPKIRFGGLATRDFLYIKDAVDAYLALIDVEQCGAFNFSGGEPMKILDIAMAIAVELSKDKTHIDLTMERFGEIAFQELNCSLARNLLGWEPKVKFAEGLKETVQWYRAYLSSTTA